MDAAAPPERFAAWSSSGGKDSMLALLRARAAGLEVRTMLSMFDETGARNRSHGIPRALVEAQARALGLEMEGPSASWSDYEATFVRALQGLRERGAGSVVFGDIDLQPHRDWEEKVCAAAGLEARLPLWGEGRRALAEEALRAGIRAVVVCVDSRYLDDSFCGREFDEQFLKDLPASVCPCGENGEFHTFVTDSPLMSAPLRVRVQGFRTYVSPPEFGAQRYQFADLAMTGDAAPVAAPAMTIGIDTSAPAMTTHIESPPAAGSETGKPAPRASKDPLHGITLETIVKALVERYGWAELGEQIAIRCFTHDPSVKSSLTFLRKTPWARKKVEELYLYGGE